MRYRALLLATIVIVGAAPAAHAATDRDKLTRLVRESATRFGRVFSAQAVAAALQKATTACVCFDPDQNAARVGFVVYTPQQTAGEGFTSLCLTPAFGLDGGVTGATGACADFTPLPGRSAPSTRRAAAAGGR